MTQSPYDIGFPTAPLTDPATGDVTPAWRRFFTCLWARTGETTASARGVSSAALAGLIAALTSTVAALSSTVTALSSSLAALSSTVAALIGLGSQPSVTVTPGASPYAYTAPSLGTLYVAGGGVTAMTLKRGSGAAFLVGAFYGGKRMATGDVLTITYSTAPTLNFLPG